VQTKTLVIFLSSFRN